MSLTEHQKTVLEESLDILSHNKRLLIQGSAGVGKTYLVNTLISILKKKISKKIYVSAPTHKALAVLKGKVDGDYNVEFFTIHSVMKMKRKIDKETGRTSFVPDYSPKYPPLKGIALLVVDEASMIDKKLLEYIEEHAIKNETTVIFLGDSKQLNPVDEIDSPVFIADYPTVELTEIVRQGAGNPIIDLSRNLNEIKFKNEQVVEKDEKFIGYVFTYNKDKVIEELAKVNGTDDLKYLAYTNVEVDNINKLVREKIYGNPKKIEVGETLVFNAPMKAYFTNEEILVQSVTIKNKSFSYMSFHDPSGIDTLYKEIELKIYSINPVESKDWLTKEITSSDEIMVIHEDSETLLKKNIQELAKLCKEKFVPWVEYYKFVEQFADLKYNHAITIHKSQGSTYKQAIINIRNININRNTVEKERLLYTGVTRAAELLILYNV